MVIHYYLSVSVTTFLSRLLPFCLGYYLSVSVTTFLEEIVLLFGRLVVSYDNILLAGDVNIHMDEDDIYANRFKDIFNSFNFVQHVDFPTHVAGHTLDITVTLEDNTCSWTHIRYHCNSWRQHIKLDTYWISLQLLKTIHVSGHIRYHCNSWRQHM